MQLLLSMLFTPGKAAGRIKTNPRWAAAFLALAVVSTVCSALIHPHLEQATLDHLPPGATEADKHVVIETLRQELPARLAFFPIRLFIGWSAFSLVLMYVCKAFAPPEPVRFRQVLSLYVHTEFVSVIGAMAGTILMLGTTDFAIPVVPWSVAELMDQRPGFILSSLLTSLNIFTLWQVIILTVGVSILYRFGRIKALCVVLIVWSLSLMFNLGVLKLVQDELHLLL